MPSILDRWFFFCSEWIFSAFSLHKYSWISCSITTKSLTIGFYALKWDWLKLNFFLTLTWRQWYTYLWLYDNFLNSFPESKKFQIKYSRKTNFSEFWFSKKKDIHRNFSLDNFFIAVHKVVSGYSLLVLFPYLCHLVVV